MDPHRNGPVDATRSLAGKWHFALDPDDVGRDERWFASTLPDSIALPGTTDEAAKGESNPTREPNHLTRSHPYEGVAWYQRTVTIPETWSDARVVLTLERTRSTQVWIDDRLVGGSDALSTSQQFDLTAAAAPGEHVVTVRVDNDSAVFSLPGVKRSHMATEHTQTNWNGIVGDIELSATPPVWVDDVCVTPEPARGVATVEVAVGNLTRSDVDGQLSLAVGHGDDAEGDNAVATEEVTFSVRGDDPTAGASDPALTTVSTTCDLGDDPARWDEFGTDTYAVTVDVTATAASGETYTHTASTDFGVCEFGTDGTQFVVNGRTTFLRGNVDCCIFPETGYAPTTRKAWRDVFETARSYGLNHYRFHSWCPPAAAFEAADELGVYLQVELPMWDSETALETEHAREFYRAEAERVLDAYGDHPSFVMFALGNELCGSQAAMVDLVDHCRNYDPRPLYATGSYNFLSESTVTETDDYWVTASVPADSGESGGNPAADRRKVRAAELDTEPPTTTRDYDDAVAELPIPVVSHEIGQYQIYPDFTELSKYGGVLRPRNLELARDHLEAHGMRERASEFAHASGQLALRCYREDVEAAFRTGALGGFQLLALQDFPGQGTALVGILDSFMDSKGLVTPERWGEFCGPTVALARLPSRTWTADEQFAAQLQVAHYGVAGLGDATTHWSLVSSDETVASGTLAPTDVPQGDLADLGTVTADLAAVDAPTTLTLDVRVASEGDVVARNRYDVWVYPSDLPTLALEATGDDGVVGDETRAADVDGADTVVVRRRFDDRTRELLADGATVLLVPDHDELRHAVDGTYQPDFWSYALFKRRAPPGTMGPTLDAAHPLFDAFPTADHGDWQWWHLLKHSRPVVLDDAPDGYDPLVGMVDNIERNGKLGLVFETAVGEGSLLVCAMDLFACDEEPAVRQFSAALRDYAASDAFDPDDEIPEAVLQKLLAP